MNKQILKVTKGHFYVYFNLNLRSYGQLFVLVYSEYDLSQSFSLFYLVNSFHMSLFTCCSQ